MNDVEIVPYEGIGVIELGMTPEHVREALKSDYKSFLLRSQSMNTKLEISD
jgi:hypothetical protein